MISLVFDQGIFGETVATLDSILREKQEILEKQVKKRSESVAEELQKQLVQMISGSGSGRLYSLGDGLTYRASAPGEAPAKRTGRLVSSYTPVKVVETGGNGIVFRAGTESSLKTGSYLLADLLEGGTGRMAPRPYREKVLETVMPYALRIYSAPYSL